MNPKCGQAGFTLVETLIAIVILVFGLMSITNLFVAAASSNTIANLGTTAANVATEQLENLKATPYNLLQVSAGTTVGSLTSDVAGCAGGNCYSDTEVPGVGQIHTRWTVTGVTAAVATAQPEELFIVVRSEAVRAIGPNRTRAEFTTFRACTDQSIGCP